MAGRQKTQSSTSWRPIINRTVVNILFYFTKICNETKKKKEKKLTDRKQDREQQES